MNSWIFLKGAGFSTENKDFLHSLSSNSCSGPLSHLRFLSDAGLLIIFLVYQALPSRTLAKIQHPWLNDPISLLNILLCTTMYSAWQALQSKVYERRWLCISMTLVVECNGNFILLKLLAKYMELLSRFLKFGGLWSKSQQRGKRNVFKSRLLNFW